MLTTPPFAPSVLRALHTLGIGTHRHLRQTGAVKTFLLLKASGHTLTRSILWQLAAAEAGITVYELTAEHKAALLDALKKHPPADLPPPECEARQFMAAALQEARQAAAAGEVPVGAVIVRHGTILAAAHNACIAQHSVAAHAEILALTAAGQRLGSMRLDGCDAYITLEPCSMCASALMQARIKRVIFAAAEPKSGAAGSVCNLFADHRLNAHTAVFGGILADESREILQTFFRLRRTT
ncbi:tRNA-specific adenosine deaminase [Kingella potus]|uniref:tRNA-specific adenosine deaminase n=1 Tax=Kingella potus TaxID=265175 RepID=A0A377R0P9_9NEIS|nr:tRNA-specific adenosine deaminase [Kingella potus]UOP01873.1 deaminase [Kingella potus]STQ99901.1 tRNA-specific adenosine deaminase [Kingella potus]